MLAFQIVGGLLILLALASMMSLDSQESQRRSAARHAPRSRDKAHA